MMPRIVEGWVARFKVLAQIAFMAPPEQMKRQIRVTIGQSVTRRLSIARQSTIQMIVHAVEVFFGTESANRVFWALPRSIVARQDVESRLNALHKRNQGDCRHFVDLALNKCSDPIVLINLARSSKSSGFLKEHLESLRLATNKSITSFIVSSEDYAAAFSGVAYLLIDNPAAENLILQVKKLRKTISGNFAHVFWSLGVGAEIHNGTAFNFKTLEERPRKSVQRRAIIVENYDDIAAIAQLCLGARQTTILALSDLLGSADFAAYEGIGGVERIDVEHLRSRVSRFSKPYIENHEQSHVVGRQVAQQLVSEHKVLRPELEKFLALGISDFLHFQGLKIAAIKALMEDQSFDEVLIAVGDHGPESDYVLLLSGSAVIDRDPRVKVVSISQEMKCRRQFLFVHDVIVRSKGSLSKATTESETAPASPDVISKVSKSSGSVLRRKYFADLFMKQRRVRDIMLFSASNPAYNFSTAYYARILERKWSIDIVHLGLRANDLRQQLFRLGAKAAAIPVHVFSTQSVTHDRRMNSVLADSLMRLPTDDDNSAAAHILRVNADLIVSDVVLPHLVWFDVIDKWFQEMKVAQRLPKLVVLAPARISQIAAVSAIARTYGVTTMTLEAHGLNSNYSRYVKVMTDYYGVVSEYFRNDIEAGFGIPANRTAVIGSPRIRAPAKHDPDAAKTAARAIISATQGIPFGKRRGTISFFCQPSAWEHVGLVWRSVLTAAQVLDLDVLLKTHPEEAPTRRAFYLRIAVELGLEGQVFVVSGAPNVVIEASDVVLTGYSAAALDAAVRQVPVICVTEGDVNYPIDQHAMIDAPLVRSTIELQVQLERILKDPLAARIQATQFLKRERQFVDGADARLRAFVTEILAKPAEERLRSPENLPHSVFLDGPHPIFPV